ncbi:hypothetical protein PYW07_017005 [Mythimna separata]|uniref:Uncharacterized protein n=1 Tax=Mythimna separata TaxID=271217 RepID=A0AAD7YX93_MYTSE|nr:hypothetical protein PYW07_017005 [Mythimna separata]
MPDYLRDNVVNLYIDHFVKVETTFKAAGVPRSVKALNEIREPILRAIEKPEFHTTICCKDDGDEQIKDIVGASLMTLQSKGYAEPEELQYNCETKEMKKLLEIFCTLTTYFDEMKVYNLDRNFSDRGMFVLPEYRGLGIAQEFLKVRKQICKEYGVPLHGGWVTSVGTQKSAVRDGWETIVEIPFQDIGLKHGVKFEDCPPLYNGDEHTSIKDVVGASMMTLLLKGHPEPDEWTYETQEIKKLLEIFSTFAAHFNEMKVFNLDRYFSDRGAFVRPEFRGLGIAQEICKARRKISKEHGIPIHGGWFTSAGTQKSAARDGWETIIKIPFQDLARKHGVTFEDNTPFYDGDEQIKEIVGTSMMTLQSKEYTEPEWKFETKEIKKLLEIVSDLAFSFDEMNVFNLERNFSDRGLFVCPEYRGLGIAQKLLNTRNIIINNIRSLHYIGFFSMYSYYYCT